MESVGIKIIHTPLPLALRKTKSLSSDQQGVNSRLDNEILAISKARCLRKELKQNHLLTLSVRKLLELKRNSV